MNAMPSDDRPRTVRVPNLVGSHPAAALDAADAAGLRLLAYPGGATQLAWVAKRPGWTVVDQDPAPGSSRYSGDTVVVRIDRDDSGGGVREPRRPPPDQRGGRKAASFSRELYYGAADDGGIDAGPDTYARDPAGRSSGPGDIGGGAEDRDETERQVRERS